MMASAVSSSLQWGNWQVPTSFRRSNDAGWNAPTLAYRDAFLFRPPRMSLLRRRLDSVRLCLKTCLPRARAAMLVLQG